MTEDSAATAAPVVDDPEEDTDDEEAQGDTASNTQQAQQPTEDWEARYKASQAWGTKEAQKRRELEDRLLASQQRPQTPPDPADPLASERASLEAERQRLRQEAEWQEIVRTRPAAMIEAYGEFQRGYALNPTPQGAMTAFEQSLASLAAKMTAEDTGAAPERGALPTRAEAVRPRVDASRSDAPDSDATTTRIAGAKDQKDLLAGVRAIFGIPERKG